MAPCTPAPCNAEALACGAQPSTDVHINVGVCAGSAQVAGVCDHLRTQGEVAKGSDSVDAKGGQGIQVHPTPSMAATCFSPYLVHAAALSGVQQGGRDLHLQ